MKVKPHVVNQHQPVKSGTVTGRFTSNNSSVNQISNIAFNANVSLYDMMIFNPFESYIENFNEHSSLGMRLARKWIKNTFGFCPQTQLWWTMVLERNTRNMWVKRWKNVELEEVPKEYQAAALLLSAAL